MRSVDFVTNQEKKEKRLKQRSNPRYEPGKVFDDEAEEERYKRYKNLRYRNLAVEAAVALILGMLTAYLFKL